MKLTKSIVDRLSLPETGQVFTWDDTLKGFGVRCTPGSKSYVVQGRVNGRVRRITLGSDTKFACDEARKLARDALAAMQRGKDPNAAKKAARAKSVTLREVTEQYIATKVDLKPSSVDSIRKHVFGGNAIPENRKHVRPALSFKDWADEAVVSITRETVLARYRKMQPRSTSQANQAMRVLQALLTFATATYSTPEKALLPQNPVRVLSDMKIRARVEPRRRRIPVEKMGVAWTLLEKLRTDELQTTVSRTGADIVEFLLLTGCRWSEAAKLEWSNVDIEGCWWRIVAPKNRNTIQLPLSTTAVALLQERTDNGSPYVFEARAGDGHIKSVRGTFDHISEVTGAGPLSAHDMRRSFLSIAVDAAGIELWRAKLLANHISLKQDVTIKHYLETGDLRRFAPEVEKIATWIVEQSRIAAAKNVVKLKQRA